MTHKEKKKHENHSQERMIEKGNARENKKLGKTTDPIKLATASSTSFK